MAQVRTIVSSASKLASQTVHIKIYPTPQTFSERREVLRVLERYGQVTMFRSLKYDPASPIHNAFLSTLSTSTAAESLINASPIRYRLVNHTASTNHDPQPTTGPVESASGSSPQLKGDAEGIISHAEASSSDHVFELQINPSTFPHENHIQASPLHGPWTPVSTKRSIIAADLADRVPRGIGSNALCDWETESALLRTDAGRSVGSHTTMPWRMRVREKQEKRVAMPTVMNGLKALRKKNT